MINLERLSNYIEINSNTQTLLNVAMARINDVLGYDLEYQLRKEKIQSNKVNPIYISYRPLEEVVSVKINGIEQDVFKSDSRGIELVKTRRYDSCYCKGDRCYTYELEYYAGLRSDNISEAFIYDIANLIRDLESELSGDSNITNYKINDISYNFDKTNIASKISNIVYRWF
jgi:hypothetical protein